MLTAFTRVSVAVTSTGVPTATGICAVAPEAEPPPQDQAIVPLAAGLSPTVTAVSVRESTTTS